MLLSETTSSTFAVFVPSVTMLISKRWWYSPILPLDRRFPQSCRQTLVAFLLSVSSHVSRKRPSDMFLNFLTNTTSIFIVFLGELSNVLMAPSAESTDAADAIQRYLEQNPESSLANVLSKQEQQAKLNAIAEDILQTFLESHVYRCEPTRVFLKEVLAGVILESTLSACSKPEWINGWIVYLLEDGEPEIMNAIDAGVGGAQGQQLGDLSLQTDLSNVSGEPIRVVPSASHGDDERSGHKRKISNAEAAMEEAMLEAKRLSELIAAEEARKVSTTEEVLSSADSTEPVATPNSSESDITSTNLTIETTKESSVYSPSIDTADVRGSSSSVSIPFTSFDQIVPPTQPSPDPSRPPPLTLYNAKVSIFDDAGPSEKGLLKSKPQVDYLLQVEPASSQHRGWMIARRYSDFETLHEVLRRISVVSGVTGFTHKYSSVPGWKNQSKKALCFDLEAYLRDALSHSRLAGSEGMKRFLENDQALGRLSASKGVIGFPTPETFQNMGKGMLDVLTSAPKGAAGGGKALFEGVSGVFGAQKKSDSRSRPSDLSRGGSANSISHITEEKPGNSRHPGSVSDSNKLSDEESRPSAGSSAKLADMDAASRPVSQMTEKPSNSSPLPQRLSGELLGGRNVRSQSDHSVEEAQESTKQDDPSSSPKGDKSKLNQTSINLPPPPSEITDDYALIVTSKNSVENPGNKQDTSNVVAKALEESTATNDKTVHASTQNSNNKSTSSPPLNTQETQVALELFFAFINELYTLSSAWNIRRTLLNAAKTYLLRQGNPNLEAIRVLLQDTVIDANSSDEGIASHLRSLRESSLPTEQELSKWPAPATPEEQERLRIKARKLLVEKGMPQALTSVMGAAASGQALGHLFDSLQVEDVSRGLVFALLLQAIRAIAH